MREVGYPLPKLAWPLVNRVESGEARCEMLGTIAHEGAVR